MTESSPLRVGIIGTGVGIRTLVPGFRATGQVDVVGIVGSSYERALECAKSVGIARAFDSYRELVDSPEVDLVCVASPNINHFEEAMYAMKASKHLLVEKPLASSLAEAKKLAQATEDYISLAVVDHQLRFNPYIREIRRILKDGRIGRPYFVRIHQQGSGFSRRDAAWNWSFDEKEAGGVLLAMGSHLLDLLWFWFGQGKVYSACCAIDPVVMQRTFRGGSLKDIKASSFFSASVCLENQITANLSATAAALGESKFDIDIFGTEGELHFDLPRKLRGSFLSEIGCVRDLPVEGVTDEESRNAVSIFKGSFVYFARKIVAAIRAGGTIHVADACTFGEAARTQEVLDALKKAAADGCSVRLDSGYSSPAVV